MNWQEMLKEATQLRRKQQDDQEDFIKALFSANNDISSALSHLYRKTHLGESAHSITERVDFKISYRGTEEFVVALKVNGDDLAFTTMTPVGSKHIRGGKIQDWDSHALRDALVLLYYTSLKGDKMMDELTADELR